MQENVMFFRGNHLVPRTRVPLHQRSFPYRRSRGSWDLGTRLNDNVKHLLTDLIEPLFESGTQRFFPLWGETFRDNRCNSREVDLANSHSHTSLQKKQWYTTSWIRYQRQIRVLYRQGPQHRDPKRRKHWDLSFQKNCITSNVLRAHARKGPRSDHRSRRVQSLLGQWGRKNQEIIIWS